MAQNSLLPEERARIKIDRQLTNAGWDIVSRDEYVPRSASAVKEALMQGNTESDYLLFVDDKAIAVVEAKREENPLGGDVQIQAEDYACNPQDWYGVWFPNQIPLVYLANGNKIYFKNMLQPDSDYIELSEMYSPKKMLKLIGQVSEYGALPHLDKRGFLLTGPYSCLCPSGMNLSILPYRSYNVCRSLLHPIQGSSYDASTSLPEQ